LWLSAAGTVWSGVQAAQAGQFGAWAAGFAVSMALGAIIPMPNFSNFYLQAGIGALKGAAIGAIAGGVGSLVAGGSFGEGAGYGALGGAAGGLVAGVATSQQYQNFAHNGKWMSNSRFAAHQSLKAGFYEQRDGGGGTYGKFGLMASGKGGYRHAGIFVEDSFGDTAAFGKYQLNGISNKELILGRTTPGALVDEMQFKPDGSPGFYFTAESRGVWGDISYVQAGMLNEYIGQGAGTFALRTNCADWALGAARYIGFQTPENVRTFGFTDPAKLQDWLN